MSARPCINGTKTGLLKITSCSKGGRHLRAAIVGEYVPTMRITGQQPRLLYTFVLQMTVPPLFVIHQSSGIIVSCLGIIKAFMPGRRIGTAPNSVVFSELNTPVTDFSPGTTKTFALLVRSPREAAPRTHHHRGVQFSLAS